MGQIVHITFEKLTGLKGEIEGVFKCDAFDLTLPIVFVGIVPDDGFIFRQDMKLIHIRPIQTKYSQNYEEHFRYGVNLLVKEAKAYGGGVTINSQPPN